MAALITDQLKLISQLGLVEGIKAGLFQPTAAHTAAVTALTAVTTADATDAATTQALVNQLKVKVNQIIAALKA